MPVPMPPYQGGEPPSDSKIPLPIYMGGKPNDPKENTMLSIIEALTHDKVVVTTTKDKSYVGKLVDVGDGQFVVRTGKGGRPPHVNAGNIKRIDIAS